MRKLVVILTFGILFIGGGNLFGGNASNINYPEKLRDVAPGWGYNSRYKDIVKYYAIQKGALNDISLLSLKKGEKQAAQIINANSVYDMFNQAYSWSSSVSWNGGVCAGSIAANGNYASMTATKKNNINISTIGLISEVGWNWMGGQPTEALGKRIWPILDPDLQDALIELSEITAVDKYIAKQESIRSIYGDGFVTETSMMSIGTLNTQIEIETTKNERAWGAGTAIGLSGVAYKGNTQFQSDFKDEKEKKTLNSSTTAWVLPANSPFSSLINDVLSNCKGLDPFLDGTVSGTLTRAEIPSFDPPDYKKTTTNKLQPSAAQVNARLAEANERKVIIKAWNTAHPNNQIDVNEDGATDAQWEAYNKKAIKAGNIDLSKWDAKGDIITDSSFGATFQQNSNLESYGASSQSFDETQTPDANTQYVTRSFKVMLWKDLYPNIWHEVDFNASPQQVNLIQALKTQLQLNALIQYLNFIHYTFPVIDESTGFGITFTKTQWKIIDDYLINAIKKYSEDITNLTANYEPRNLDDPIKRAQNGPAEYKKQTDKIYNQMVSTINRCSYSSLPSDIFECWTNNYNSYWSQVRQGYFGLIHLSSHVGDSQYNFVVSNEGNINDEDGRAGLRDVGSVSFDRNGIASLGVVEENLMSTVRFYPVMTTIDEKLKVALGGIVPSVFVSTDADINKWTDKDDVPYFWAPMLLGFGRRSEVNDPRRTFFIEFPNDIRYYGSGLIGKSSNFKNLDGFALHNIDLSNSDQFSIGINVMVCDYRNLNLNYNDNFITNLHGSDGNNTNALLSLSFMTENQMRNMWDTFSYHNDSVGILNWGQQVYTAEMYLYPIDEDSSSNQTEIKPAISIPGPLYQKFNDDILRGLLNKAFGDDDEQTTGAKYFDELVEIDQENQEKEAESNEAAGQL